MKSTIRISMAVVGKAVDATSFFVEAVWLVAGLLEILLRGCILIIYLIWLTLAFAVRWTMRMGRWMLG